MVYANRVEKLKSSFVRDILSVTNMDEVISFAGGLPNPALFPIKEIKEATVAALEKDDSVNVLQYAESQGDRILRKYIVEKYYQEMDFNEENIIITNGSQQGLDLLGKLLINPSDEILIEDPCYLGALQAFSVYEPTFVEIELQEDGLNIEKLASVALTHAPKFLYCVPNFQNPTGLSYTLEKKQKVAAIAKENNFFIIEDTPYLELNFNNKKVRSFMDIIPNRTISLGSFSKIFAPSLRLGWIAAEKAIIDKILLLKQAADLHTNFLAQKILVEYLQTNQMEQHIQRITHDYKSKKDHMLQCMKQYFPKEVSFTEPDGGMFIWVTLPQEISSWVLLESVRKENVLFVPGTEFCTTGNNQQGLRLNYTNSTLEEIEQGIRIIAQNLNKLL